MATENVNGTDFNADNTYSPLNWSDRNYDDNYLTFSTVNPTRIVVDNTGDYFVALNLPLVDLTGTGAADARAGIEAAVFVDGTEVTLGTGRGSYIRGSSGGQDHFQSGCNLNVLVPDVDAGSYIEIYVRGVADTTEGIGANDMVSLYVEYVDSSEEVFSGTGTTSTAPSSNTDLNQGGEAAWTYDMEWVEYREDSNFTHDDTTNPNIITLSDIGYYYVTVNIPQGSAGARTNVGGRVELDGVPVFGSTFMQGYIRNVDGHEDSSVHWAGLVETNATNQNLTVGISRMTTVTTAVTTDGLNATIYVRKIANGSTGLFHSVTTNLTGAAPNDWNPATTQFANWSTDNEIDTDYYSHTDGEENITILQDGHYLISFNSPQTVPSDIRLHPQYDIRVNGVAVDAGRTGSSFMRDTDGHEETTTMITYLAELSANDIVSISVIEGDPTLGDPVSINEGGVIFIEYKRPSFTVDLVDPSPANNTVNYINFTAAFNVTIFQAPPINISCGLYVNDSLQITNSSVDGIVTTSLLANLTSEGTYTWYVNCSDILTSRDIVTETRFYRLDTTPPFVTIIYPEEDNTTLITTSTFNLNATAFDNFLDQTQVTAFCDDITQEYQNLTEWNGTGVTLANLTDTINLSACGDGNHSVEVCARDSATESPKKPNFHAQKFESPQEKKIQFYDSDTNNLIEMAFEIHNPAGNPLSLLGREVNLSFYEDGEHITFGGIAKLNNDKETITLRYKSLNGDKTLLAKQSYPGHFITSDYEIYFHHQGLVDKGWEIVSQGLNSEGEYLVTFTKNTSGTLDFDPIAGGLNSDCKKAKVCVDTGVDVAELVPFTTENGTLNQDFINVNVSAEDVHGIANVTIFLFKNGTLESEVDVLTPQWLTTFSSLADNTYIINATVTDTLGNRRNTDERLIILTATTFDLYFAWQPENWLRSLPQRVCYNLTDERNWCSDGTDNDYTVAGNLQANSYIASDGSAGMTNTTGIWMCEDTACTATCLAEIRNGLIVGCT